MRVEGIHPIKFYLVLIALVGWSFVQASQVAQHEHQEVTSTEPPPKLQPETLRTMVQKSDLIFVGTVRRMETFHRDRNTYIVGKQGEKVPVKRRPLYTDYVIEIHEVLKGNYREQQIPITQFGGFAWDGFSTIGGFYFLKLDQDYVVFAKNKNDDPDWGWRVYRLGAHGRVGALTLRRENGVSTICDDTPALGSIYTSKECTQFPDLLEIIEEEVND